MKIGDKKETKETEEVTFFIEQKLKHFISRFICILVIIVISKRNIFLYQQSIQQFLDEYCFNN